MVLIVMSACTVHGLTTGSTTSPSTSAPPAPAQWTIVRYAFKGNTQVAVTEKGYADRPGPDQYR